MTTGEGADAPDADRASGRGAETSTSAARQTGYSTCSRGRRRIRGGWPSSMSSCGSCWAGTRGWRATPTPAMPCWRSDSAARRERFDARRRSSRRWAWSRCNVAVTVEGL